MPQLNGLCQARPAAGPGILRPAPWPIAQRRRNSTAHTRRTYAPLWLPCPAPSSRVTAGGVPLRDVCLSPYAVLSLRQWQRLATAAVVHVDATHLVSREYQESPGSIERCVVYAQSGG